MIVRRFTLLACLALALQVAGARPVAAAALAFTGTLTLQLMQAPETTVVVSGSGVALVTGAPHLSSFLLSGGTFGPVTTLIGLNAATGVDLSLVGVQNLGGSFAGGGGTMGFQGFAGICVLSFPCSVAHVPLPVAATGAPPVGFGIGGTQTVTGAVTVTAQHAPWALSAPAMTIHSPTTSATAPSIPVGFIHGPASGSASSAAQPSGVVQLVTATKVFTNLTAAFPELPMYAVLNLHFVPEPGTLALLAAAAAGLLAAGRVRR